jgi:hypothetical protein
MHVLFAYDLAAEPDSADTSLSENRLFGHRHLLGFPRQEFHPAGGTARLSATGMKLIGASFLAQSCSQTLARGHFELPNSFDGQFRHGLNNSSGNSWPVLKQIAVGAFCGSDYSDCTQTPRSGSVGSASGMLRYPGVQQGTFHVARTVRIIKLGSDFDDPGNSCWAIERQRIRVEVYS